MYSQRSQHIEPFRVMEIVARAKALERAGHDVVHFEVGEPDFATAAVIVDAARAALDQGHTKYTEATGIPELRSAIATFYRVRSGVEIDPHRVIVTSGASGALNLLSLLLVDAGDEWLMADPGYPCNRHFWMTAGASTRLVPVGPASEFNLTAELAVSHWSPRTKGVLIASPANPTGAMLSRTMLAALVHAVHARGGRLVVDEIYQGLTYGESDVPSTVLALDDDAFVVNSFSKYFGMTGWRLGWMVAPEDAIEPLSRLAQNLYIAPSTIAQYAALAAFSPDAMAEHERRRLAFAARRDLLSRALGEMGLPVAVEPKGAFYLYVDIRATGLSAEVFCQRLLEEAHVAVTPGTDFGKHCADQFVRFAYTTGLPAIREGIDRVARTLSRWRSRH